MPGGVKRVTDAMEADPAHPFTTNEPARLSGVPLRSLQNAFRAHHGVPMTPHLRNLRLAAPTRTFWRSSSRVSPWPTSPCAGASSTRAASPPTTGSAAAPCPLTTEAPDLSGTGEALSGTRPRIGSGEGCGSEADGVRLREGPDPDGPGFDRAAPTSAGRAA
ncbi:hypothetical protein GCM10010377_52480 [Streptomyces viridiviolaceus]|nr:hypothetical protein GCM10010377_52480 [Streptomyces viridiviolaceus]